MYPAEERRPQDITVQITLYHKPHFSASAFFDEKDDTAVA
jgi:hypothetical protein